MWSRACALFVVLVLGVLPDTSARGAAAELPLDQQVGQLVVLSFHGATAPAYVRTTLSERHAAGVILFGGNITSPAQLRALTTTLRAGGGRPLVAVDQEGGRVRRVPWIGPTGSEPEQAAADSVRPDAVAAATALRALGVTVTLAPVADVLPSGTPRSRAGRSRPTPPS